MPGPNGTTALSHITKCRLCNQAFSAPPMDVPIIGEPPAQKTMRMLQALGKHISSKHPDHYADIVKGTVDFTMLLMGLSFDTTDPALLQLREMTREQVHNLTAPQPAQGEPSAPATGA